LYYIFIHYLLERWWHWCW